MQKYLGTSGMFYTPFLPLHEGSCLFRGFPESISPILHLKESHISQLAFIVCQHTECGVFLFLWGGGLF